jgi:hypothetical protein
LIGDGTPPSESSMRMTDVHGMLLRALVPEAF